MEIFLGILALLFALVLWIVFVPVYLRIDTRRDIFELKQAGTVQLSILPGEKTAIKVKVFGLKVPSSAKPKAKKPKPQKERKKPFFKRSFQTWIFLIKGIFRSFRIKALVGTADLDDFVLHAQFFALSPLINHGPVMLTSNLNNQYFLHLLIEGKLHRVLYTFILFLIKK